MKKVLAVLFLSAWTSAAYANVTCSVPFNLTNGTTADASQVMANYNAILSCLANGAAASGVNNDITQLSALTVPLTPAQGGNFLVYTGSGSSGTASNTIVVPNIVPNNYALPGTVGQSVTWVSDGANSGPTQANIGGTGYKNFYRETPSGPQPMVGGEITAGQVITAQWDGTEYQMTSAPALAYAPGAVFDYAGSACPAGSLVTNGSSIVSQTTYATLYADIGTIWGAAAGGNFTIPDLQGRATFGVDTENTRITVAGGNFAATSPGAVGGQQNMALTSTNQLPQFTPSGTIGGSQNAGTFYTTGSNVSAGFTSGVIGSADITINGSNFSFTGAAIGASSPSTFPVLSNAAIVWKCIKG